MKTKMSKKEKLFAIINSVLVVAILGFYLFRTIYYKKYFDNIRETAVTSVSLSELIIKQADLSVFDNGLVMNNDQSYTYKGYATNNYVQFGNIIFRVVGISEDGAMTLVSDKSLFSSSLANGTNFIESALNTYLNKTEKPNSAIFSNGIIVATTNLGFSTLCIDAINDINNIGCALTNSECVFGLLSLNDYSKAGASNSYLNNGEDYWLINEDNNGNYWYVDEKGGISTNTNSSQLHGVRVLMTLNFNAKALSGNGSEQDPYVLIKSPEVKTASDLLTGQYVSYSDSIWKVSLSQDNNAILMLDGRIDSTYMTFGSDNSFNLKNGVGKYLNTTYLSTLTNYEEYLINTKFNFGKFTSANTYMSSDNYQQEAECYVFIPTTSMPFFNDYSDCFLGSRPYESDKLIFVVNDNDCLYAELLSQKAYVRPVICLNGAINIVSGSGTKADPFVLEDVE